MKTTRNFDITNDINAVVFDDTSNADMDTYDDNFDIDDLDDLGDLSDFDVIDDQDNNFAHNSVQMSLYDIKDYDIGCITLKLKQKEIHVYYTQSVTVASEFRFNYDKKAPLNENANIWLLPEAEPVTNVQLFASLLGNPSSTVKMSPKDVISEFEKDKFENTLLHNHLLKIQTEI